jgi:uncharacterized SAM-binding protein YcdF (DUF218 family)
VNHQHRLASCALGCVVLVFLLTSSAVLVYGLRSRWLPTLGYALDVPAELRTADVIIILGGGNGDRENYGSALYRRGLARHVIATGSPVGTTPEALGLVRRGIPRQAVVLANGTQNTHEDALRSRELMQENHWRTALLVTDPYHIRRSLWTFRTAFAGTSLQVWPAPVVGGWFNADHWWQSEQGFISVNDEYLKLVYYVARGYITPSSITEQ